MQTASHSTPGDTCLDINYQLIRSSWSSLGEKGCLEDGWLKVLQTIPPPRALKCCSPLQQGKEDGNRRKHLWRGMKEPEVGEMLVRLERKEDFGGHAKL